MHQILSRCGVLFALVVLTACAKVEPTPASGPPRMDAAQAEARVRQIINGPVTHLPRTDEATVYSPGWFHPGAETPDFKHADVRTTQEFTYDNSTYVTSDLNPTEMFLGRELEFNAQTKYFYEDRSLPKRKLSEADMLEINHLYRIIGAQGGGVATQQLTLLLILLAVILSACLVTLLVWPKKPAAA
jgi:hypothetical protein